MKRASVTVAAVLSILPATACGAGPSTSGTFTMAIPQDPGNLDPNQSVLLASERVISFGYDRLVFFQADGTPAPWLAKSWDVTPTSVRFTLNDGITCVDGTPFDAKAAAANFNYTGNPDNNSVLLGREVQEGTTATADVAARTVTVTVPEADPFLLRNLSEMSMICPSGLEDPSTLRTATNGTGLFELTEAVAGDHYTFVKRDDYEWGPNKTTSQTPGLPDQVVLKVVTNTSTAANLLISGDVNAASISGPDLERVEQQDFYHSDNHNMAGELWFNQDDSRPGADPAVRQALVMALDLPELAAVLTDGRGEAAENLYVVEPVACPGDTVSGNLPEHDPAAAATLLDEAGWEVGSDGVREKDGQRLEITHVYIAGESANATAELVRAAWTELGADVELSGQSDTQINAVLFESGQWDTVDVTLQGSLPTTFVPFLSGQTPPDGLNFAGIDNPGYEQDVRAAEAAAGDEARCADWNEAQVALFENVDVVPYATKVSRIFGNGASWDESGVIPPTIRMGDR